MNNCSLIIRINYGSGAVDWNVERPDLITFQDTLASLISLSKRTLFDVMLSNIQK